MKKFSAMPVGETVVLPTPVDSPNITVPKLKMKKYSTNPPSVAVFTKHAAAAIFPAPAVVAAGASGVKHASSVSVTVDSAVVSLEVLVVAYNLFIDFVVL
jgi:hypothetical protein